MRDILFQYEQIELSTWFYLSSLLLIAFFFKFNRVLSVRNLDLLLLILLTPGLLLVNAGRQVAQDVQDQGTTRSTVGSMDPETRVKEILNDKTGGSDPSSQNGTFEPARTNEEASVPLVESTMTASEQGVDVSMSQARSQIHSGRDLQRTGFIWLFGVGGLLLIRLLVDPTMVRRPLLEPNLTTGSMIFLILFFFMFWATNVVLKQAPPENLQGPITAARLMAGEASDYDGLERNGPGYAVLFTLPMFRDSGIEPETTPDGKESPLVFRWRIMNTALPKELSVDTRSEVDAKGYREIVAGYAGADQGQVSFKVAELDLFQIPLDMLEPSSRKHVELFGRCERLAKFIAIGSHLAVLLAMIAIGYWHFHNIKMGIAPGLIYLMLPYTLQMTVRIDHLLPAALLIWAFVFYRKPLLSGLLLGFATGVIYYPLFLLPLWISFYWQRGLARFLIGWLAMLVALFTALFFASADWIDFWDHTHKILGLAPPHSLDLEGIWGLGWPPVYRFSVLAAFVAVSGSLAIWPGQKNLGTLMCCTGAVMVATQFWHGYGGGLYLAWYLPSLLLTVFRPNLEDRISTAVLRGSWPQRRKQNLAR